MGFLSAVAHQLAGLGRVRGFLDQTAAPQLLTEVVDNSVRIAPAQRAKHAFCGLRLSLNNF
jgi:hypothetical protein